MLKRLQDIPTVIAILAVVLVTACGPQTSTDGETSPQTIKVTYNGASTDVALDQPTAVTMDGASYARLSEVVMLAVTNRPIEQLAANFLASDGFDPASRDNCATLLPIGGDLLRQGYIDPVTRNVKWDESLQYPGCLSLRDTAEIKVSDK